MVVTLHFLAFAVISDAIMTDDEFTVIMSLSQNFVYIGVLFGHFCTFNYKLVLTGHLIKLLRISNTIQFLKS